MQNLLSDLGWHFQEGDENIVKWGGWGGGGIPLIKCMPA